jgi:hypothetical protein
MCSDFKKIVFLEGLPGIGKSYLVDFVNKNYSNVLVSDEIMNKKILLNINQDQNQYIINDELKFFRECHDGKTILLIDRGFISTYSYNITNSIINNFQNYKSLKIVQSYFNKIKYIYQENNVEVLFLISKSKYKLPYQDQNNPYGSVTNQDLLQSVSLYLCKKYVKNFKIIFYDYEDNFNEVIYEIVN